FEHEAVAAAGDAENAVAVETDDAGAIRLFEQRLEHVAGPVRVGKQLAAFFLVKRDAELFEEADRLLDGKRSKHLANRRSRSTPEVALGAARFRRVPAPAAADEDLRAGPPRAVEQRDPAVGPRAAQEDRGCQASRTRADDGDVRLQRATAG